MRREGDYYENEFCKKATALAMSVLFAVSMAGCGSSASTAKKVEVTSVEDLADLKIGVQTGTTGDSQASDAVNADSQMQRYNKGADAIQALKNGKIDCVVIDSLPAEKFVAANDDLKIVEGILIPKNMPCALKGQYPARRVQHCIGRAERGRNAG